VVVTRADVLDVVASTLAAECGCQPGDFAGDGIRLSVVPPARGGDTVGRRFPRDSHSLTIATMGAAAVVAATPTWMPWATELFGEADPREIFGARLLGAAARRVSRHSRSLHGPLLYACASRTDWRAREAPRGYRVTVGGAELMEPLSSHEWPNAASPRAAVQGRAVAVAAVATERDRVAGVATATSDSDDLWQIGVDVRAEQRGRGLGAALTSRVTDAVLGAGRVPYYGTAPDNVASRRVAHAVGFFPVWVSAFTSATAG